MKKRRTIALLLVALLGLSGCSASGGTVGGFGGNVTQLALPEAAVTPAASADANAGLTRFGVDLLRRMRSDGGQVVISPLSAVMALSMTANGADGDTLAEFESVLGADLAALNANAAQLMADYADLGGSTRAGIANSIWADADMRFYDRFLEGCAGYDPGVFTADLDTSGARRAVNRWISGRTDKMIPEMLTENLPQETAALLINAVCLENAWAYKFKQEATGTRSFFRADGSAVNMGFMHQTRAFPYFSADGVAGALLPYDDGRLAFAVLLPDGSLDDFLAELDGDRLAALLSSARSTELLLALPKFSAAWSGEVSDALADMGLSAAFDAERADFSNLGTRGEGNIYLEFVMQAARLEVNEEGTRAAAATVAAPVSSSSPANSIEFTLNRPFLYAVWDTQESVPLFLGTFEGL